MHPGTVLARRRLYLLARVVVARHYRRRLTLPVVAGALASSPRQLQRAYEQFGEITFHEDLFARRMAAAAQLLSDQPALAVRDIAHLVGYRQAPHFAKAFRRRYGLSPARFRAQARRHRAAAPERAAAPKRPTAFERPTGTETRLAPSNGRAVAVGEGEAGRR
jgi:AraC-like DNA-binding protein